MEEEEEEEKEKEEMGGERDAGGKPIIGWLNHKTQKFHRLASIKCPFFPPDSSPPSHFPISATDS